MATSLVGSLFWGATSPLFGYRLILRQLAEGAKGAKVEGNGEPGDLPPHVSARRDGWKYAVEIVYIRNILNLMFLWYID